MILMKIVTLKKRAGIDMPEKAFIILFSINIADFYRAH